MTRTLEEEKARQWLGIPLDIYNNMVGGRRWAYLSPYSFGAIICKADVLVSYRELSSIEPVIEHIKSKKNKRG